MTDALLDIARLARAVQPVDRTAQARVRARLDSLAKPVGALGRLEELAVWLGGVQGACPPRPLERVVVVVVAGDHGVSARGVSAYPAAVTPAMVRAFLSGGAAVSVLARQHGAEVRVLDLGVDVDWATGEVPAEVTAHKVRRGSGSIDTEDALSAEQVRAAVRAGIAVADAEVDAGADLLVTGDMGIGNTTVAAALVATLLRLEPAGVVGRGTGVDDAGLARKTEVVAAAVERAEPHRGDVLEVLRAVGSADVAAMAGFLLRAAVRRTPVLLDGVVSGAAALAAQALAPSAPAWWLAGHRSPEPAHTAALHALGLEPLIDYGMRLGEGTGALTALPLLRSAALLAAQMVTLDDLAL